MDDFGLNGVVFSTRPQTQDATQNAVYDALDALAISYVGVEHEPAGTIAQCQKIEDLLQAPVCKNLFLCNRQKTAFYLLVMPPDKPFYTRDITAQIQSARLSFADGQQMQSHIGCQPGSASIFGLLFDPDQSVQLLVDEELLQQQWLCFHPCRNTATLKLRTDDVLERFVSHCGHPIRYVTLARYEQDATNV